MPIMNDDDNDGQIIFGGLKLLDICLTGEEKARKTSPRKLVLTRDRTQARCMTGVHATAWPTVVDSGNVTEQRGLGYVLIETMHSQALEWPLIK